MILPDGEHVFMIIADEEISTSVVNLSTSKNKSMMPYKTSGGVLYRIVEVIAPVHTSMVVYKWYLKHEIIAAWEALP